MWHIWGENIKVYGVLMGIPEVKTPLRRHRLRWENNIKVDLEVTGRGAWTGLV
jgi:hypothetical protein